METAPRDGTAILLFSTSHGIVEGWYAPFEPSFDHEGKDTGNGDFWVIADDAIESEVEHHEEGYWDGPVKAWMPLPPPPEGYSHLGAKPL